MARKATAKSSAIAFVRVNRRALRCVTSGSSKYARIAAIAIGIRMGWRNAINLTPSQMTEAMMPTSTTTKKAERAAHMV